MALDKKNSRGPRIVLQDKSREDQGLPAPEASIPDVVVDDTEYGNELTGEYLQPLLLGLTFMAISMPPLLVEDVGDSIEGEGEPAEVSTGMCQSCCGVRLLSTCTGQRERLGEHSPWGWCHSLRCRTGGCRIIRSSQSRPRRHLCYL